MYIVLDAHPHGHWKSVFSLLQNIHLCAAIWIETSKDKLRGVELLTQQKSLALLLWPRSAVWKHCSAWFLRLDGWIAHNHRNRSRSAGRPWEPLPHFLLANAFPSSSTRSDSFQTWAGHLIRSSTLFKGIFSFLIMMLSDFIMAFLFLLSFTVLNNDTLNENCRPTQSNVSGTHGTIRIIMQTAWADNNQDATMSPSSSGRSGSFQWS